ncbi:MAG: 50S ribosomal protein L21 [Candidatus Colwellbacteria bacterium CG10_big_fil_rev_8_21_14_0_10_41_28]|uniref:Large ribosomal subunit protein bL21 n=1 Tax=Candidatus Colwellbacteria bacterium CG10_big_fil_rev_8_21_14_0_10_41_28 TaxID=1974539 RepID=A0A2H0VHG4_9BACT|nr:MAG: 50S ribosomal protein L21 [Candidatus Colwellbacteria bacterium CG10_big_fil_rev_8_21_14_0_10_41_28]
MYAVIEAGGKQYRVSEGEKVRIEKVEAEEGKAFVFDKVLLLGEGESVKVGTPYVSGAKVEGEVLRQARNRKIIIFKYKPKKRQRTKGGHRQPFTEIKITKISG